VKLARLKRPKAHVLSHMWNTDLIKMKQYYETVVTLREDQGKKETKNLNVVDIHSIQECI
jgi:hypothetical protein